MKQDQISMLTMSLAHLHHAGVPAADALYLLAEDAVDQKDRAILTGMANNADEGMSLAACFQAAGAFPGYLCTLLAVGESVGKTEQTLTRLSRYYQGQARLRRQLKSALIYPGVLLAILLAVLTVLLVWVMPVFDGVYAQLGGELTAMAAFLQKAGQTLGKALPWIGGVTAAVLLLLLIPVFRRNLMKLWKKYWGDRGVWKRVNNARFMQVLSLGITSGMTEQEAVEMAEKMADTQAFQKRCEHCRDRLSEGESLPDILGEGHILEAGEKRLLEAGIRSGQSEKVMTELSDRLLEKSEEAVEGMAAKAEPTVIIITCILIGAVLLSVMLPLLNIMNTIG